MISCISILGTSRYAISAPGGVKDPENPEAYEW